MKSWAHELKTLPEYFEQVSNGKKKFEIRRNDRDFQVGDHVILREFKHDSGYTGKALSFEIGYMTDYEQKPGYVVFSLLPIDFGRMEF